MRFYGKAAQWLEALEECFSSFPLKQSMLILTTKFKRREGANIWINLHRTFIDVEKLKVSRQMVAIHNDQESVYVTAVVIIIKGAIWIG